MLLCHVVIVAAEQYICADQVTQVNIKAANLLGIPPMGACLQHSIV